MGGGGSVQLVDNYVVVISSITLYFLTFLVHHNGIFLEVIIDYENSPEILCGYVEIPEVDLSVYC